MVLKGKINKAGHIDYSIKGQVSENTTILASAGLESSILKGKSDASFGLAFETTIKN